MSFITDIDLYLLDLIQTYIRTPVLDKIMVFITLLGNGGFIWIIAAVSLSVIKKYRRCGLSMIIALVFCMMIGNGVLKPYFARIRPFDLTGFEPLIKRPGGYSFPSGHTMAAFSCVCAVIFFDRVLGMGVLVLAVLMAFSRMYLYMHYPTDILGGIFFGAVFGCSAAWIAKRICARMNLNGTE
ncbi:MAG: phosphatase PAP2 family protein [Oscillospiraceae bacterium]|nr:phosphatase PAP2 family protein [Oscillospiraceae bacterium]